MDNSTDNAVPSILLGDPADTIFHSLNRGGDNSDTGRWLTSLVSDALEIATHGDAEQPVNDDDINTMVRWVAQLFNEFELYKIDFNAKAVGTDLTVSPSNLNLETLSASNDHFEGHLSTRYWSLAFDASTHKLDVYLIPAELLLAFTTNRIKDTEYKPFITFLPRRHSDEYFWFVDNQRLTYEMLPQLAKELFGDLIRVASGNVSEQEFFDKAPNQAAERAQVESSMYTDRSFEEGKTHKSATAEGAFSGNPGATTEAHKLGSAGSGFPGSGSNADATKSEVPAQSAPIEIRQTPLTNRFFDTCKRFSDAIDLEMKDVIEFAKTQPDNVAVLLNCKHILTELDALRVTTNRTMEQLEKLSAD